MTRINAGIKPAELPNNLLLAELREIKRIPNMVCSGRAVVKDIPKKFTLGTGHVKFFYDKGAYTLNRYISLLAEARRRGLNVQSFATAWVDYPTHLHNDWEETLEARELLKHRIEVERGFKLNSLIEDRLE